MTLEERLRLISYYPPDLDRECLVLPPEEFVKELDDGDTSPIYVLFVHYMEDPTFTMALVADLLFAKDDVLYKTHLVLESATEQELFERHRETILNRLTRSEKE